MDGKVIREDAIAKHDRRMASGASTVAFRRPVSKTTAKQFTLRIESEPMMSHIDQIRLTPLKGDSNALEIVNAEIGKLNKQVAEKQKAAPKPRMVMAVKDGKIQDIKLHIRGSHRDLGKMIPRGAPIGFGFQGIPDISQGPKRPITTSQMVGPSRSPSNSAGDGKSGLAVAFWPGNCCHPKQFWHKGATTPHTLSYWITWH